MLGNDLLLELERTSEVVGLGHRDLDIVDESSVSRVLDHYQPSVVVNCAAYTNVDGAEKERELARLVNASGPANLARACNRLGAKLIHFSTDQVFDGDNDRPWTELDVPNPLNYYARTKLDGEGAVLNYPRNLVLRVQWLYGIKKERFTQLKRLASFSPFLDQRGAPTWTMDIARVVPSLLEAEGLFHFAYDDSATWVEVFTFVKEILGLKTELCPRYTHEAGLPAKRPLYCVLSNQKLRRALNKSTLGSWKDALPLFLKIIA